MSFWDSIKNIFVSEAPVQEEEKPSVTVEIVSYEVDSVHGREQKMVFYKVLDGDGNWHNYGPVISTDPSFNVETFKEVAAVKVAKALVAKKEAELSVKP